MYCVTDCPHHGLTAEDRATWWCNLMTLTTTRDSSTTFPLSKSSDFLLESKMLIDRNPILIAFPGSAQAMNFGMTLATTTFSVPMYADSPSICVRQQQFEELNNHWYKGLWGNDCTLVYELLIVDCQSWFAQKSKSKCEHLTSSLWIRSTISLQIVVPSSSSSVAWFLKH